MNKSVLPATPYKGLIPYAEEDAQFFFGRDPDQEIITANLIARRLTLLYGPSGVGKSSVLRAGVEHHLLEQARQNLAKRGKPEFAVVVFNQWRDTPSADLELEVLASVARVFNGQPPDAGQMPDDFVEMLRINTERVGGRLLIILDQFEEYFLYHAQEDGPGTFATEFPRALSDPDLPINFLISIREDALAKLDRFEGRIPHLFDNYLRIEHLDSEAAREAIERPVARYNQLLKAKEQKIEIEPALVNAVLGQVKTGQVVIGEAGRGVVATDETEDAEAQIETPFLQLVMTRLWQEEMRLNSRRLRLETLNRLGGAKRIVETHLDEAMGELSDEEQRIASLIFQHLVTRSRTKIAYPVFDLAEEYRLEPQQILSVVETLSGGENRILRPVAPPLDQPELLRYEIFHDVLANAILDWRARYVQSQKQAEAEQRAEEERRKAEEQARIARKFRWLAIAMTIMFLLAIVTSVVAFTQQRKARLYAKQSEELRREGASLRKEGADLLDLSTKANLYLASARQEVQAERERAETLIKLADTRKREADAAQQIAKVERERSTLQEREVRIGYANLLGVQAKVSTDPNPPLGLLLATEAIRATKAGDPRVPAAEEAMLEVLSRTGGRIAGTHDGPVEDVTLSPDNRWMVSRDGAKVKLWNLTGTNPIEALPALEGAGRLAAFSPDNHWLITSDGTREEGSDAKGDPAVRLYDLSAASPTAAPRILQGHSKPVSNITISPNSRWLVTSSSGMLSPEAGRRSLLWDLTKPDRQPIELPLEKEKRGDFVPVAAFSPDNHWLVTSSWDPSPLPLNDDGAAYLWDLTVENPALRRYELKGHARSISNVLFSPDSHWLATSSREMKMRSGRIDDTIRVWDLTVPDPTAKVKVLEGHREPIGVMKISSDSQWLVTGCGGDSGGRIFDNAARVWNLASEETSAKYVLPNHDGPIFDVAISPDNRWVVTFTHGWTGSTLGDFSMRLWDVQNEKLTFSLREQRFPRSIKSAQVSADNRWLVTISTDNTARVWDLTASDPSVGPRILRGHESQITSVNFSPDNQWVVTGSEDKTIRLWGLSNPSPNALPLVLSPKDNSFFLSPDHHWLATRGPDFTILLWDLTVQNPATTTPKILRGHKAHVDDVAFSSDNRLLVTGSHDETARVWNLTANDPSTDFKELKGHTGVVENVTISQDNHWLVTGSFDGSARVWDLTVNPPTVKRVLSNPNPPPPGESRAIFSTSISSEGRWVVTSGQPTSLNVLWDLAAADPWGSSVPLKENNGFDMSPDSRWLVVAGKDRTARLWNLKNVSEKPSIIPIKQGSSVSISPNGRWLITSREDNKLALWDLTLATPAAKASKILEGHTDSIAQVSFSPDSHWLASGSADKTAILWDLTLPGSNYTSWILPGHDKEVSTLAFSPDNHWLMTGCSNWMVTGNGIGTNYLWDLTAKNPADTATFLPIPGYPRKVAFSQDNQMIHWLIVGDYDRKTVSLWNLRLNELEDLACQFAGRDLTEAEWKKYFPGKQRRPTCQNLPLQR